MSPVIPTSWRIVPLDVLLAAQRVHVGCLELGREGYHGIVGACATGAA